MTEALFDAPGSTSAIKWDDHMGKLVLIWPTVQKSFTFNSGDTGDVIEARVVVLDPPGGTPVEYANTVIFPKILQGQVRGNIGKRPNLGRIGKGLAKSGQSAPWILEDPTEADQKMAVQFLTSAMTTTAAEPAGGTGWSGGGDQPPF